MLSLLDFALTHFEHTQIIPGIFGPGTPGKDPIALVFQIEGQFARQRGLALSAWPGDQEFLNVAPAQFALIAAHLGPPAHKAVGQADAIEMAIEMSIQYPSIIRELKRKRKVPHL